jgi:exo-beta-1,3-glucanase (GH17 family)
VIEGDNEPYNISTWDIVAWSARMLACAKAAKAAGRKFLLPVGPPWNNGNVMYAGAWTDCVAAINHAQPTIWQYVDGISIHPYSQPYDPSIRTAILDKWRSNLTAAGHGAIPFWLTEFGWPTGGSTWPGANYNEQTQADYYTKAFQTFGSRSDVAAMIPYRLDDFGARDADSEHWFGLNNADGSHKAAYTVVKSRVA